MKIKVKWEYSYMQTDVYEEIIEVPDGLDPDDARQRAYEGAQLAPNGDLEPVDTYYPGSPVDDLLDTVVVDAATPATIRYVDDDEGPVLVRLIPTPATDLPEGL